MKLLHIAVLTSTCLAMSSQAAIIDNGDYTTDTATGLDWLDLTQTFRMSYNQVIAELQPGQSLEGWRYASLAEHETLLQNFGFSPQGNDCFIANYCDTLDSSYDDLVESAIWMLGDTLNMVYEADNTSLAIAPDGAGAAAGILGDEYLLRFSEPSLPDDPRMALTQLLDHERVFRSTGLPHSDIDDNVYSISNFIGRDEVAGAGSYLVRPSEVPLPASAYLFFSAFSALILGRSRRHTEG